MKVFILLLFFTSNCFIGLSQLNEEYKITGKTFYELKHPESKTGLFFFNKQVQNQVEQYNTKSIVIQNNEPTTVESYTGKAHTAFFCRLEDKLEKKIQLPVKMRVGELDYVDYLEQKRSHFQKDWYIENIAK